MGQEEDQKEIEGSVHVRVKVLHCVGINVKYKIKPCFEDWSTQDRMHRDYSSTNV